VGSRFLVGDDWRCRVKIWLQKHTVEGRLPLLDDTYRRHVAAALGDSTEVRIEGLPPATYETLLPASLVRYPSVEAMVSWHFAAQAFVAEQAGYDAYVIGASTDPGLFEAREIASIPVLGLGQTAFFYCARHGLPFAIVGCVAELSGLLTANIDRYGLGRWLVGSAYLEDGPALIQKALQGEQGDFVRSFEERARSMIDRGARVIIPGEGLPNEALFAAGVSAVDGTPILDANGLLLRSAVHDVELVSHGVAPVLGESVGHQQLPPDERQRLFDLFAPRAIPRT